MIGGDYATPKVRLPGAGGAPEIAASCGEVIVVVRQNHRAFVERVDFVTSVGYGTGPGDRERLGLHRRRAREWSSPTSASSSPTRTRCELTLTGLHPGVTASSRRGRRTGWDLAVAGRPGHDASRRRPERTRRAAAGAAGDGVRRRRP